MSLFEEIGTDYREARTERGVARVWVLTPSVYVTETSGHMEEPHADLFERYGSERIARASGKLTVFHDWIDMKSYESICRIRLTRWSLARLDSYAEVHLGVASKLVAMGVQVANLALGGLLTAHSQRARIEYELRRVLREHGVEPPEPAHHRTHA
jgi:hypothetical protein